MAKLQIITAPDPILRKRAHEVDSVDDSVRLLMDNMLYTLYAGKAIGLAANQVGVLKRVLVLDLQKDDEQQRPEGFYPLKIANPEIIEASDEIVEADEGCMSLPEQTISVRRSASVKIKYLDYDGKSQELNAEGWLARAIQHEMDHLDGKLLVDYLSNLKKDMILRKLVKLKKLSE